jgi:tRNA dimethylallyltransferase
MFENGLLDEVAGVVGEHAQRFGDLSVTARKLHGLEDCVGALSGAITQEEAELRMVTRTRQYAKRQDTWARRWDWVETVPVALDSFDASVIGTLLARQGDQQALSSGDNR